MAKSKSAISLLFLLLPAFTALAGETVSIEKCESLRRQIDFYHIDRMSIESKFWETGSEVERLKGAVQVQTGQGENSKFVDDLRFAKNYHKQNGARLVLLERVRKSVMEKAKTVNPALKASDVEALLNQELETLRAQHEDSQASLLEAQKKLEELKSLDLTTSRNKLAKLSQELNQKKVEIDQLENKQLETRKHYEDSNCQEKLKAAGRLPKGAQFLNHLERAAKAETPACQRLHELAKPAITNRKKAQDALNEFNAHEFHDAELIARAEEDPGVFDRARLRINELEAEFAILLQKRSALDDYRANPGAHSALAPIVQALTAETMYLDATRVHLENSRKNFDRIKRATESAKSQSLDDKREARTRLENKQTALQSALDAATAENEKALEPFYKSCGGKPNVYGSPWMLHGLMSFLPGMDDPWESTFPKSPKMGWPAQPPYSKSVK